MNNMNKEIISVDKYIAGFPDLVQQRLQLIRAIIKETAPDAIEDISYGMPAYKKFKKPLVYFAAFKNHIGLYALPSGHKKFKEKLSAYKQGKGSVQFPSDQPLPTELIKEIVQFRALENFQQKNK